MADLLSFMLNHKFTAVLFLAAYCALLPQHAYAGDFISRPNIGRSRFVRPQTAAQRRMSPRLGLSEYTMTSEVKMQIQLHREQRRYEKQLARYQYDLYRNEENARIKRVRQEIENQEKERKREQEKYARMMEKQREEQAKRDEEEAQRRDSDENEDGSGSVRWNEEEEAENDQPAQKDGSWLTEEKSPERDQASQPRVSRQPKRGFWYAIKRALGVA